MDEHERQAQDDDRILSLAVAAICFGGLVVLVVAGEAWRWVKGKVGR